MGRVFLTAVAVVVSAGVARAAPTRKVTIETVPPGAKVYLNATDEGPVCEATPCTIDAPVGTTPIIVALENYGPVIDALDIPKKGRPMIRKYTLEKAIATLVVEDPIAKGASVRVDDEDKGKAPLRIDISGGDAHHVILTLNGKTLYDEYLQTEIGDETVITPKAGGAVATREPPPDGDGGSDGEGTGDGVTQQPDVTKQAAVARDRFVSLSAVFDVGFRQFSFEAPKTGNAIDEIEGGQLMAGPVVELWPMEMLKVNHLRGLSVFARYEYGFKTQQVDNPPGRPLLSGVTTTSWDSLEVSARHRWMIADTGGLEASAGFVRDKLSFVGDAADVALVPDATYKAIRLGLRGSLRIRQVEPYLAVENRIVFDGGALQSRFSDAKATGLRAAIGAQVRFGQFAARVEASALRYSWSFTPQTMDSYRADGATDAVELISTTVSYLY